MTETRARYALGVILAAYLALGTLYAAATPPWQVPDEPAHYNYVRHLAEQRHLPELRPGDYPAAYLEEIKALGFPPEMSIDPIRYESHQPPLYYALMALVYGLLARLGAPMPLALRLATLLLGAGMPWLVYRVGRALAPADPVPALGAAAFAATLPMHLAMSAAVNNDVLSNLLLTFIAWRLLVIARSEWTVRRGVTVGVALGLALLTKMQAYVGVILAAYAFLAAKPWRRLRAATVPAAPMLSVSVALGGPALALALPWLARNVALYGPRDPLAMARHDLVVAGQLTTAELIAQHGLWRMLQDGAVTTFRSFWGQFGWMGVLMDERLYLVLAMVSGLAAAGLLGYVVRTARGRRSWPPARAMAIVVLWVAASAGGYLWWNLSYVQHQGRYLFPALAPLGLAFSVGLREILRAPLHRTLWLVGAPATGLLGWGLVRGDLPGTMLALLLGAGLALVAGHLLESRRPGLGLAAYYLGQGALAAAAPYLFIVPALAI